MRIVLAAMTVMIALTGRSSADDWQSLFNGKDLNGWKGDPKLWSVKEGAITGVTDGKIENNSFIVWNGKVSDFELKVQYKIVGGNSGIQYRSKFVGDESKFVIAGYQADIDSAARKQQFVGICYEERGRGFLCNRGTKCFVAADGARYEVSVANGDELLKKIKENDWNEYHVTAKANHLIHAINGVVTSETIDFQADKRSMEGLLAFQIHKGMGDMTIQYKDIKLKKLTDCKVLTPETAPIPKDAKKIEPPKPKKVEKK